MLGTVPLKNQFGSATEAKTFSQFAANVSDRRVQALHGSLRFLIASLHHNHYASGTGIVCQAHFADVHQANARIAQFAFDDGFNLFADGLSQPAPMMLYPSPLQLFPLMKTDEYTRKPVARVAAESFLTCRQFHSGIDNCRTAAGAQR